MWVHDVDVTRGQQKGLFVSLRQRRVQDLVVRHGPRLCHESATPPGYKRAHTSCIRPCVCRRSWGACVVPERGNGLAIGSDVRLRVPLAHDVTFDTLSLAARGKRLLLGATTESGKPGGFGVRYLEFDTTSL